MCIRDSIGEAHHRELCTPITYPTNPPAGGDHWFAWAAYRKYDAPVARPMLVHNMEHGGIVLFYRCADACPDVVAALDSMYENMPGDCPELTNSSNSRLIRTPDAEIPTPIAAAAWGSIYMATCIDTASLTTFVKTVYDQGPEKGACGDGIPVPPC